MKQNDRLEKNKDFFQGKQLLNTLCEGAKKNYEQ